MLRKRNGQSVLEYVVIFTVVAAAVVAFVASSIKTGEDSKSFGLGKLLKSAQTRIEKDSGDLVNKMK
jgi:hypothetical protein